MKTIRSVVDDYFSTITYDKNTILKIRVNELENMLSLVQNDAIDETARVMSNLFGGCSPETKNVVIKGLKSHFNL